MAIHAGLRRRHIRRRRNLNVTMAIPAIHAELVHMDLMGKRHRLHRLVTLTHVLGREIPPIGGRRCAPDHEEAKDEFNCEIVCPAGEKVSHSTARAFTRIRANQNSLRIRVAALLGGLKFSFSNRTVRDLMAVEIIALSPLGNQIFNASLTPSSGLLTTYPVIEERTVRQMRK